MHGTFRTFCCLAAAWAVLLFAALPVQAQPDLVGVVEDGRALFAAADELILAVRAAAAGKTFVTPAIAARLDISPRTVEFHKYPMMETLGVTTSAELIRVALQSEANEI